MSDGLERMWAGWRSDYVRGTTATEGDDGCVLCRVSGALDSGLGAQGVHRGDWVDVLLNAYPYNSGHVLVLPKRHVADLDELQPDEHHELWGCVTDAVATVKRAYRPDGVNVGVNQGAAAGAGIPDHVHVHVLPRWSGDTGFSTAVAGTRILPETLEETGSRLRDAWAMNLGRYRGPDE